MPEDTARPGNAAEHAYTALRDAILSGAVGADERLTEMTIAEQLGISRTPVREAVKRLIIEGFVTRERGQGLRVTTLAPDEVEQIFNIRLKLESYAARRAAEHASEAEIAELHRLASEMSAHTPPQSDADLAVISDANAAFHRQVMLAARSPRLGAMLSLAVNLGLVLRTYRIYSAHDMIRQSRHHHEIVEAIASRAPDWAEAAMAVHVQAAAAVARQSTPEKNRPVLGIDFPQQGALLHKSGDGRASPFPGQTNPAAL
jgi:DNA-binding GntR family transcriptional regulator